MTKREFITVKEETEEVIICDDCGREADDYELVPKQSVVKRLEKIEKDAINALENINASDIPSPTYEEETEGLAYSGHENLNALYYTSTLATSGSLHQYNRSIVREYGGIDTDEQELIEKAEELQEEKDKLVKAVRNLMRGIKNMSNLTIMDESVTLCTECFETRYRWDDEN